MKTLKENGDHAVKIILAAVPLIAQQDWTDTIQQHKVGKARTIAAAQQFAESAKQKVLLEHAQNMFLALHMLSSNYCWT